MALDNLPTYKWQCSECCAVFWNSALYYTRDCCPKCKAPRTKNWQVVYDTRKKGLPASWDEEKGA